MSALARAHDAPELLDEPAHDEAELRQSLAQIAAVNHWLGGTRALLRHIGPLINAKPNTAILDIGTGSAELPRAIAEWARQHHRSVQIVATDVHPQMLRIAAEQCRDYAEIAVLHADALRLAFAAQQFDVATVTLTLHHFEPANQVRVLQELARVSRMIIVNDLRRTRLNYLGARLLAATLWRGNRLTRHDGPLSVLRAFTGAELKRVAEQAGLTARAHYHFFQRVVLVAHG